MLKSVKVKLTGFAVIYQLLVKNAPGGGYDRGDIVGIFHDGADLGPWCDFRTHRDAKSLPPESDVFAAPEWQRNFVTVSVSADKSDLIRLLEPQIIDESDPDVPVIGKQRRFQLASPASGTLIFNDLLKDGATSVDLVTLNAFIVDKGGV